MILCNTVFFILVLESSSCVGRHVTLRFLTYESYDTALYFLRLFSRPLFYMLHAVHKTRRVIYLFLRCSCISPNEILVYTCRNPKSNTKWTFKMDKLYCSVTRMNWNLEMAKVKLFHGLYGPCV